VHTLAFVDPGHFHAALTLAARHPGVDEQVFVYAPKGPELDDFLALVEAFNHRAVAPTRWRPVVRSGRESADLLRAERPGNVAVLAGRNDTKIGTMRQLHDAGFHVLADKPWLAGAEGLDDVRHVLAGGPLAVEIMTGRHDLTSILTRALVADADVFGDLDDRGPAIELASVHHLEKRVNGAPLRRPAWFFDVRVQGDGIADIPTHMVDQAQRLVSASLRGAGAAPPLELTTARRWATRVPLDLFCRVTGVSQFPRDLSHVVSGSALSYEGNAELVFRAGRASVAIGTRWDLSAASGGGDTHRAVIRGTRAEIRVQQDASTGFRRRLTIWPRSSAGLVRAALERAVAAWQGRFPGVALADAGPSVELAVPGVLDTGHESHFPLVLAEFLDLVERGVCPAAVAADTLAKYTLLARASAVAGRPATGGV
jgi:predicted dehydrogenase